MKKIEEEEKEAEKLEEEYSKMIYVIKKGGGPVDNHFVGTETMF